MKTLKIFLGVCVAVTLMGLNIAVADIESSSKPMTFAVDIGDGTVMPDISFDMMGGAGEDTAQTTCMMTPGGGDSINVLLDLPPIIPVHEPGYAPLQATLAPINSIDTSPSPIPRPFSGPFPPDPIDDPEDPDDPPLPVVPAPATVLIVGLGIAGVALMRRRRTKM